VLHAHANVKADSCEMCETVVTMAEGALAQNNTEQEIETVLRVVCGCESYLLLLDCVKSSFHLIFTSMDEC
jgi:uncharacterized RmlC-like cupin family protein